MNDYQTIVAGSEKGAWDKLYEAMRLCSEGSLSNNYAQVMANIRRAHEASVELGVHVTDTRWGYIAMALEKIRTMLSNTPYAEFGFHRQALFNNFNNMLEKMKRLRLKGKL